MKEEHYVYLSLVACVLFFAFAALVVPPQDQPSSSRKQSPGRARRKVNKTVTAVPMSLAELEERAKAVEQAFDGIYRSTFQTLQQEHEPRFLNFRQAHTMIHHDTDAVRRPRCGGWVTLLPSLALRYMGVRCPPLNLI